MGVDITLGLVVLIAAIRGYMKGFVLQAIRLGSLAGGIYAAGPIRDYARPYIHPNFPTIAPELLDRLVWWAGSVVSYLAMNGLATWLYQSSKKRPLGEPEPDRADQGAGFVLGAAKGVLVASALALVIDQYALGHLKNIAWLEDQSRDSKALVWSREYQPAQKVWESPPVQTLVQHVRENGLMAAPFGFGTRGETLKTKAEEPAPPPADRQASAPAEPPLRLPQPPSLAIPTGPKPEPGSADFLRDFDRALEREGVLPKSR